MNLSDYLAALVASADQRCAVVIRHEHANPYVDELHMRNRTRVSRWGAMVLGSVAVWCAGLGVAPRMIEASDLRQNAIVRAVEKARPSVVNIHGRKSVRSDQRQLTASDASRQVNGMGTGIIIDPRGYILTNYHVVEGVAQIKVTMADQQTLTAELIARDPATDLAIIKIPAESPLPVLQIGTSQDLKPGEDVIAVGNAYGYTHTVTRGIISALHRSVQVSDDQHYQDLIQTDASINPGNSGGPLLNIYGEMIGINVAVRVGAQGIGFALPIDHALEVAAQLLNQQVTVAHGVSGKSVWTGNGSHFEVVEVKAGTPGEKAGLEPGDIILSLGDVPVHRTLDWYRGLIGVQDGEELRIEYRRGGQSFATNFKVQGQRSTEPSIQELAWRVLGLRLASAPPHLFGPTGDARYRGGLQITAVRSDGPAAQRGVRRGDVLVGLHKWETVSIDDIAYILSSSEFRSAQPIKFFVLRGDETLYGLMRVSFGE